VERVAIFAALRWECQPVVHRLRQTARTRVDDFPVWRGRTARREVWVVQTGVGPARSAAAARAIHDAGGFRLFVSTGCAGALHDALGPGDLTVATSVMSATETFETDRDVRERMRTVAERAALSPALGAVLCSPIVLATAAAKRAAAAGGAIAVEMEGAPIASCAARAAIPFAAVRAILDAARSELRHVGAFVEPSTGRVRPLRLARYLARHPSAVPDLLAMQRMMTAAQRSLHRFFDAWLREEA